jgi:riboflavin-specific deaminase-like protein
MPRARAWVTANFALTWDGKISTRRMTPAMFSSPHDKRRLLEIRASADAILVGKATLMRDNMAMGLSAADLRAARVRKRKPPHPFRVIITNSGRIKSSLRVFTKDFSPIFIYSTRRMPPRVRRQLASKAVLKLADANTVDIAGMLCDLRQQHGIKRLVCEGGSRLFRSLITQDLVDEINLTFCPLIFGGRKAPTLTGLPGDFLPRTIRCRLQQLSTVDGECFARYRVLR